MILRTGIRISLGIAAGALLLWTAAAQQQQSKPGDLGFTDTPILPGMKWHVHDPDRPHPPVVTPGATPYAPPSDAIVLFDGKDLSKWAQTRQGRRCRQTDRADMAGQGRILRMRRQRRPDDARKVRRHPAARGVERAAPDVKGTSQGRGNSGILIMSRYEIQVLDAFKNPTYADGQAGAIYGQWPPLANPARPPGQWQTYDIVFEAPRFDGEKLVKPAYQTVFMNNVLMHNHKEVMGADGVPQGGDILGARGRRAAGAAGPSQSGTLPEYLGPPHASLR